jgi:hypothetical protein
VKGKGEEGAMPSRANLERCDTSSGGTDGMVIPTSGRQIGIALQSGVGYLGIIHWTRVMGYKQCLQNLS